MSTWIEPIIEAIDAGITSFDAIEETGISGIHKFFNNSQAPRHTKHLGGFEDILENSRQLMTTYKQARAELQASIKNLPDSLEHKDYIKNLAKLILIETDQIHGPVISRHTRTCTKTLIETNRIIKSLPNPSREDIVHYLNFAKKVIIKKPSPPYRLVMGAALMLGGAITFAIGIKLSLIGVTSLLGVGMELTGAGFRLFQKSLTKEPTNPSINRKVELLYASLSADMKNLSATAPLPNKANKAIKKVNSNDTIVSAPIHSLDKKVEEQEFHTDTPFEHVMHPQLNEKTNTNIDDTDGEGLRPGTGGN